MVYAKKKKDTNVQYATFTAMCDVKALSFIPVCVVRYRCRPTVEHPSSRHDGLEHTHTHTHMRFEMHAISIGIGNLPKQSLFEVTL